MDDLNRSMDDDGPSASSPLESDMIQDLTASVEGWIRQRPIVALLAAAATGFAIARLVRDDE